jgi:hypothetical protein
LKAAILTQTPNKAPQDDLATRQARSRRARNIAIGVVLGLFVVLVYVVTVVKLGPGAIVQRGM